MRVLIEKGISRPPAGSVRKVLAKSTYPSPTIYPFREMQIGDSFFIPAGDLDNLRLMNQITSIGRSVVGVGCVSARQLVENGQLGVRCWLIDRPGGRIK